MAQQWNCLKCGHTSYETDRLAATGGGLSKFFDIQNKRYLTVTCTRCGFTEFYKGSTGALENIFDFFMSR